MSQFDKIKKTLQETPLLNRYLKSRGINPDFATKDQKVAHSKTAQFKTWMMHHVNDNVMEAVDKKDTITFDIPLLIRVLEFAREDLKSDINLHQMVERLISIRGKGTLTMNQYGQIVKEEFGHLPEEQINEISAELQHSYFKKAYAQKNDKTVDKTTRQKRSKGMNKVINRTLRRNTISTPGASQDFKDQEAKRGIGHVRDHVEIDGDQLDETWKYHTYPDNTVARAAVKAHHEYRDEKGMASGNPARAMGNGKVAYKGEFKGPKPQKSVAEAKEANYGGDYQASVLAVKAKAEKKPVDMKSLAARMQASYAKDEKKPVKEDVSRRSVLKGILGVAAGTGASKAHSIAGAFPSPSTREKWRKDAEISNAAEAKRQAEKKKKEDADRLEKNTAEVEKQQKVNHHSLANEEVSKKSVIGRVLRGHELKKKVDSTWKDIGDAQKAGDKEAGSKAFRKHERYANLERPGTWTKVKNESLEPTAACNCAGDGANNPDDTEKSTAKKVKLLLGAKKKVNEEMYDHEKEDKPSAALKRPKVLKLAMDSTKEAPQAAAVLKGGKTLTGEPRDTIEIDPMMKTKKPQKNG